MAYGPSGSSLSARLADQYRQQEGRDPSTDPGYSAWVAPRLSQLVQSDRDAYERSKSRWRVADRFAMVAAMAPFAAAAPALFAGGGAAGAGAAGAASSSAGWSMPGVTAPVFGGGTAPLVSATAGKIGLGSRVGAMFNSNGANLGVNAGLSLYGMHSQNKANDQARRDTLAANAQAIDLQLKQIEEARRNADLDRDEMKRLNDQTHALELQRFALDKDARDFEQRTYQERETRLQPMRQRGQQALDRLSAMWHLG